MSFTGLLNPIELDEVGSSCVGRCKASPLSTVLHHCTHFQGQICPFLMCITAIWNAFRHLAGMRIQRITGVRYSLSDTLRRTIKPVPTSPIRPQTTKPVTKPKNWEIAPILRGPNISPISLNDPAVPKLADKLSRFRKITDYGICVRPHNSNP